MVIHHSAFAGAAIDRFSEQAAAMRQIERQHLAQGWDGIGYNYVIFQPYGRLRRARVFEGRGWGRVPSAQALANSGTVAVCVVGNFQHERVRLSTRWALVRLGRTFYRRGVRELRGHRDYNPTACPGDRLYSLLPWIRKRSRLK